MSLLKRALFSSWTSIWWMVLFMDFLDWALNCFVLEIWFLEGERDERFLFFSFMTYFTIFNCQSIILVANYSRLSHDYLQYFINFKVSAYGGAMLLLGCFACYKLDDLSCSSIFWMLLSYFFRSFIYLAIWRFSVLPCSCCTPKGFLTSIVR